MLRNFRFCRERRVLCMMELRLRLLKQREWKRKLNMLSFLILLAGAAMSALAVHQINETRKVLFAPKLPPVPFTIFWSLVH